MHHVSTKITKKLLIFATNIYDIRFQQVKICVIANVNSVLFYFSKGEYYKISGRFMQVITAGYLPNIASLWVSIMHYLVSLYLQMTKIGKQYSDSFIIFMFKLLIMYVGN